MTTPSTPPPPADETREQKRERLFDAYIENPVDNRLEGSRDGLLRIVEAAERAARAEEREKTIEECAAHVESTGDVGNSPGPLYDAGWSDARALAAWIIRERRAPRPAPAAEQAHRLCVKCGDQLGSGETGFCAQCAPAPEPPPAVSEEPPNVADHADVLRYITALHERCDDLRARVAALEGSEDPEDDTTDALWDRLCEHVEHRHVKPLRERVEKLETNSAADAELGHEYDERLSAIEESLHGFGPASSALAGLTQRLDDMHAAHAANVQDLNNRLVDVEVLRVLVANHWRDHEELIQNLRDRVFVIEAHACAEASAKPAAQATCKTCGGTRSVVTLRTAHGTGWGPCPDCRHAAQEEEYVRVQRQLVEAYLENGPLSVPNLVAALRAELAASTTQTP